MVTAEELLKLLTDIKNQGVDLKDLPLVFWEENVGIPAMKHHVTLVNVKRFNDNNETQHIKLPLHKRAIVIGVIKNID